MSYNRGFLVVLLLGIACCYTELTLLNCPAQFSETEMNTTINDDIKTLGDFIYAGYLGEASVQRVESIVVSGDKKDLDDYTDEMMVPYIIFCVIYLTFFFAVVSCCLFQKSCPPCDSIRRNVNQDPYTKKQLRVTMFFTTFIALGIMIVVLISFSYLPALRQNLEYSSCSLYLSIDSAINGDDTFGGFTNIRDKIGNITNSLSSTVTEIQGRFTDDEWLVNDMSVMKTSNLQIYKQFIDSQLITPNPSTTQTAANAGQDTPMIDSLFIKTGMGPNGTVNTMVNDVDTGLRTTQKLSEQAYAIYKSAKLLEYSSDTISTNSASSQNSMLMYIQQLQTMSTEFKQFADLYFNQKTSNSLAVFQAVMAVVLGGSMLMLLGIIATHFFDLLICRRMLHLGWVTIGLAYVGMIAILFALFGVGSIGYSFCNYYDKMLTNNIDFNRLGDSYTQNVFTRVDTCLFGTGNILQKFSIQQEMNTVTDVFTNIETYYSYTNSASQEYVDTSISIGKLSGWATAMSNYKLGIYIDSDTAQTSDDNPNYALSTLNKYTYQGGGFPTGSLDVWVWDKTNCTDPTQIIYEAIVTEGTTLSSSNVTCISFNQKLKTGSPNIWSVSDFTKRYVQIRNDYASAYAQIVRFGATLISFRDSRINTFQAIEDALNSIKSSNENFNTNLDNFKSQKVDTFVTAATNLNNLITNSLDGLVVTSNCLTLGDKLKMSYNVFCVNVMGTVIKLAFCCLALLFLMLFAVCLGSRFGTMYAEIQKMERINMPLEEVMSAKDIDFNMQEGNQRRDSQESSDDGK